MQITLHTRKPLEWLQNQLDKKKLTNKQNYIPQGLIAKIELVRFCRAAALTRTCNLLITGAKVRI